MARIKVWLDGEILTASDLNAEFDNALASSLTPDTLDDVSGNLVEMQAVADPYPAGAASLATTMRGEIQRLRYLLKQITGKSEWYIDPDTTLTAIAADYVHAALFDANTILASNADDTPAAVTVSEKSVVGRKTGGNIAALTVSEVLDFITSSTTGDALMRGTSEWERFSIIGLVAPFPIGTPPVGWLECDGSSLSRTTYANLFAVLGTTYGNADASHFYLPDYRGQFLRGWAHGQTTDPDKASRTNRGDGTGGDVVGAKQTSQVVAHDHGSTGSHSHTTTFSSGSEGGLFSTYGSVYAGNYLIVSTINPPTSSAGSHTHTSVGGNENRPINVNVMYCIKY
ncbi:MAG: phage tail protein [Deltaproteobacteria bacterium]|nr:phage tail protein [Deltaproteobacteria bacterium]